MTTHANQSGKVDLHSHSTASDGSLSPSGLVQAASRAGLSAMALTDHDTVEGLSEFMETSQKMGLNGFGGIELSLEHPGTFHLLGLNVAKNYRLPGSLKQINDSRRECNLKVIDLLNRYGFQISLEEVLKLSGNLSQAGRPHFVSILVSKGYFSTPQEVYDQLLGNNKPGYVKRKNFSIEKGLEIITAAGWATVLAHPITLGLSPDQWPRVIDELVALGLVGLEIYHHKHNPEHINFFLNLAKKFNLVPTAGSDFHGEFKPQVPVDWVRQFSPLGLEMIEQLHDKIK